MKNIKTLSTLVLAAAVIATAQTVCPAFAGGIDPNVIVPQPINTGLGEGLGGAIIDSTQGGFAGTQGIGTDNVTLNFNGDSVVNWRGFNLNSDETLNFNAVDGATNLTILNTVTGGISHIYGTINANEGIGQLIISNPNGMLFDGAHFTTAADCNLTLNATPMYAEFDKAGNMTVVDARYSQAELNPLNPYDGGYNLVKIELKDSDFNVGGDFSIVAPNINISRSSFALNNGKGTLKLATADGSTFLGGWISGNDNNVGRDSDPRALAGLKGINLQAIEVDGNVEIVAGAQGDLITIRDGGNITGDLNIDSNDCVAINMTSFASDHLYVGGDVNIVANGEIASVNNTTVGGNLDVYNKSGIVEVKDVVVKKDMHLTADNQRPNRHNRKSEIWIDGHNEVGGNVFLNAIHNILIGNNRGEKSTFSAGGSFSAHAQDGHVMVTSDIAAADNISLRSDNYNVLTDGEAVLKAQTYEFYSNGYIGGLGKYNHDGQQQDLRSVVESYTYIPTLYYTVNGIDATALNIADTSDLIINGGTITNLEAGYARIKSLKDLIVEKANVRDDLRISAVDSDLDLSSEDIHVGENRGVNGIYVGSETESVTVAQESRDFNLFFNDVHSGGTPRGVVRLMADEVLTGELADFHNTPKEGQERAADTTLINGKAAPVVPPTQPTIPTDTSDNVKLLNTMNNDLLSQATDAAPVNTPTAYAADLDDDDNASAPIRQNVDGSVTIVKEMAAGK